MSREIKFRGRHIISGKWFYGFLLSPNLIGRVEKRGTGQEITEYCVVDPETVGQYTGVTDKNGKEIFEKDIVIAATDHRGTSAKKMFVEWNEEMCNFSTSDFSNEGGWFPNIRHDIHLVFEIIGDIYQNRELLKEDGGNNL